MAVTASLRVARVDRVPVQPGRHSVPAPGRHRAATAADGRHSRPPSGRAALRLPSATAAVCGVALLATVGAVAAAAAGPSDDLGRTVSAWAAVGSGTVALPLGAAGDPVVAAPVSLPRGGDHASAPPAAGRSSSVAGVGAERGLGRLTISVVSIRVLDSLGITGDGTRIVVDLRVRPSGDGAAMTPSAELVCANTRDTGNYYADGTLAGGRELSAGESVEGTVVLGMPASLGARVCTGATVRLVDPVPPTGDPTGLGPALEIPVPADVLDVA